MAYQKLQVSRAITIIPSNFANIPSPAIIRQATNTSVVPSELEDVNADFIALNVAVGDVVYNTTTSTAATITQVIDNTRLLLNNNIFLAAGNSYTIYTQNTNNEGCVLYIGTGGDVRVGTHAGDDTVFSNLLGGTFFPVQVLKVFATGTTSTKIVALW